VTLDCFVLVDSFTAAEDITVTYLLVQAENHSVKGCDHLIQYSSHQL